MTFYENFKRICDMRGESPSTVARKLGISTGTVSNWKATEARPSSAILRKLAAYLSVSTDYLLTGEEPEYVAYRTADEDVLIFDAIDALRREDLRRLVLRLSKASDEEIRKVHGFLDLTQIGGSVDG